MHVLPGTSRCVGHRIHEGPKGHYGAYVYADTWPQAEASCMNASAGPASDCRSTLHWHDALQSHGYALLQCCERACHKQVYIYA